MRVVLVDDEELALEYLECRLQEIGGVEVVGKYTDPFLANQAIVESPVDLVFVDIEMRQISGLKLAELLLEQQPDLQIAFVTAYDDYAIQAFELDVLDYLTKPVQTERLKLTLQRTSQPKDKLILAPDPKAVGFIKAFGEFMIADTDDNELVRLVWRTTKSQELFFYLLHNHGKTVSKLKLMEMFWWNTDVNKAMSQLYTTIYHIRKTIEPLGGRIRINSISEGYMMKLDNIGFDRDELEHFLLDGHSLNEDIVARYEEVLKLYRGEYLAENDYKWAVSDVQRYQLCWIRLKLNLIQWLYGQQEFTQAFAHVDYLCARFPQEEEAHLLYLRICDKLGYHSLIHKRYAQLESLFDKEMDDELVPAISAWYEQWRSSHR